MKYTFAEGLKWMPNIISILRLALTIPYVLLFFEPSAKEWLIALACIIALSDKIDGMLARRLKIESRLGEFLDTLGDDVFIFITWILFFIQNKYGLAIFILLLAPRIIIAVGALIYRIKNAKWDISHNIGNRVGGFINFIAILWLIAGLPYWFEMLVIMIVINLTASFYSIFEKFKSKTGGSTI